MKDLLTKIRNLFLKHKEIFGHSANGEQCHVCGKAMYTKQQITMVGSGEKMHARCYGDFFKTKINELVEKQKANSTQ